MSVRFFIHCLVRLRTIYSIHMRKFLIIILGSALIVGIFFAGPQIVQIIRSRIPQNNIDASAKVLGLFTKKVKQNTTKSIQNKSESIKTETKNTLQKVVQDTTHTITTFIEEKTASALNTTFSNDAPRVGSTQEPPTHEIDFLSSDSQNITIRKGNKFILGVKNVPAHFCLFISTTKFALQENMNISITLKQAGTYPLRFDYCDTKQSQFGSIMVE